MNDQVAVMPVIEISAAWCGQHWHEFERRQPKRSMAMMTMNLWSLLISDEPFVRDIGCWREPPAKWDWPTDFTEMNYRMRNDPYSPWCCYLGAEKRETAWMESPFTEIAKES